MIHWLENPAALSPEDVGGQPCMNVAIRCGLRATGPGLCRDFWIQTDFKGKPCGWIMDSGGGLQATLARPKHPELAEELAAFIKARGFVYLETDEIVAQLLHQPYTPLSVLVCQKIVPSQPLSGFSLQKGAVRDLADLLLAAGVLAPEAWDTFYAARHLHNRRGNERIFLGVWKERPVACGVLAWGGGHEMAITCIATLPEVRGQGLALAILRGLTQLAMAKGYMPCLVCKRELISFYTKAGFQSMATIALVEAMKA